MTQLKDTAAFEDLQMIVGNDIAGIFLARLKEFGVPEDRLPVLADEICYDIASAMHAIGDYEIPGVDQPASMQADNTDEIGQPEPGTNDLAFMEEKTDEIELPEPGTNDMAFLEEKTDEIELPEPGTNDMAFLEEKTNNFGLMNEDSDDRPLHRVKGVMSQDEIIKILNGAKSAFV